MDLPIAILTIISLTAFCGIFVLLKCIVTLENRFKTANEKLNTLAINTQYLMELTSYSKFEDYVLSVLANKRVTDSRKTKK